MKKFIVPALFLAAASAAAVPAAAQNYGYGHNQGPSRAPAAQSYANWQSIAHRKVNLDRRIDQGVRTRQLSHREAGRLKAELNSLIRLERSYLRGGLSRVERNDLDRRYDRLSAQVRSERRDRDNRRW
ncbi:hypothetical protein ACO2Q1_16060 [Brevundimonas sp. VNH65]|uniref:hypothetical protein n=1 Tax=Brevundimonas sp. VNH65 TaxID=3400917 RepID=UPI003BFC1D40